MEVILQGITTFITNHTAFYGVQYNFRESKQDFKASHYCRMIERRPIDMGLRKNKRRFILYLGLCGWGRL